MARNDDEVRERLERLEAKVERLLSLVEHRGNGHDRSEDALRPAAPGQGVGLAGSLDPLAVATARAAAAHAAVEGAEALTDRLTEAAVELTEPETLRSLTLLAQLAPRIEYAAQAAAAAPALLEDFTASVRDNLDERGAPDPANSLEPATDAALALLTPENLEALARLGHLAPHLAAVAEAAGRASAERSEVEGAEAYQARIHEAVLALTDPDTLASLVRVAELLPHLEYAVQAAAAGPALLEDLLQKVREEVPDDGARIEAGLELLARATSPEVLSGLTELTGMLPDLAGPETGEALQRLAGQLPTLEKAAAVAGWVPAAIEAAAREAGNEELQGVEPQLRAGVVLALKLAQPDTLRALIRIADEGPRIAPLLDRLSEVTSEVNLEGLVDVFVAVARPEVQEALAQVLGRVPTLSPVLEALPAERGTLEVLKTLNQAVEAAAVQPKRVGVFGLLRSIRSSDVQRSLGFALEVASRLGARLNGDGRPGARA